MLAPNTVLQRRYRVIRLIGSGGMGAVYEAIDERLSSVVAIKETYAKNDATREAFRREAQLLANLDHDVFPKVNDYFADGEEQYLVMDFVRGNDLAELMRLRESPFAPAKVLEWADHLLEALEELHSYTPPIVHRDIKPSNLKLTPKGRIVLLDFGIAKGSAGLMTTSEADDNTMKSFTPHYAPLEQSLRSSEELREALSTIDEEAVRKLMFKGTDPRTDIYSLGATLYHLLTNVVPEAASTRAMKLWRGKPDPMRRAAEVNPQVPVEVSEVLEQAMQVDRGRRPATAAEMRRMLREASKELVLQSHALANTFLPLEMQEKHKRADDERRAEGEPESVGVNAEGGRRPAERAAAQPTDEEQKQKAEEEDPRRKSEEDAHEMEEEARHGRGEEDILVLPTIASPSEQQVSQQTSTHSLPPEESPNSSPAPPRSITLPTPARSLWGSGQKSRRLLFIAALIVVSIGAVAAVGRYLQRRNRVEAAATRRKQIEQHAKVGRELLDRGRWAQAAEEFRKGIQLEPDEAHWHVKLGDALGALGKRMEAEAEFKKGEHLARQALQLKPDSASAHHALGGASFGQEYDPPSRAEAEYREAVRLAPANALYRADLGRALFSRFKYADAEAECREAIRLEPSVASNYVALGNALTRQNRYAEAETEYKTAIRMEPSVAFHREWLGILLSEQKKTAEAEAEYKEAERLLREQVQQEPNSAAYHIDLGSHLMRRKNYTGAEVEFREASRLEPSESSHRVALGSLYTNHLGKYEAAEAEYREAVRLQPNWAPWHNTLGYYYMHGNHYEKAEAAIREAIRLHPNGNYYDSLGDVFMGMKKYPEAEAEYREAVRLIPDHALIRANLALALQGREKYQDAEAEYREAVRLEPHDASFRTRLAGFLFARKRYTEAEAELREAIKLEPNNAYHHSALGATLDGLKRTKDAEAEHREGVRLAPDDASSRALLGGFLFDHKRYAEAEAEYREACKLEPRNGAYRHTLGHILTWLNRYEDAAVEYREAVKLEPDNKDFKESLRKVENRVGRK
jgi:Flp pilus assembly protein TadD/serine/threonine protein kinase